MKRLALAAVVVLSACTANPPAEPQRVNIQPNDMAYRAGTGTVQSVFPAPGQPLQRLEIRLDNGQTVYVDTESREFAKGMRVSLSEDRLIRKL